MTTELDLDGLAVAARADLERSLVAEPPDLGVLRRARARRRSLVAAVIVAVALIGLVPILRGSDQPSQVTAGPADAGPDGEPANADLLAPGASRPTAPSPLEGRSTMAAVWTGDAVVIWGGDSERGQFADGAAYDPRSDTWTTLSPGPLSARNAPAAVWTGDEVLFWGGSATDGDGRDGAAYRPSTGTWRRIADAPIESAGRPVGVWTGTELIVLAGFNSSEVAAYDPAADRWRRLPDLPSNLAPPNTAAVWTGRGVVALVQSGRSGEGAPQLVSWDAGADGWDHLGSVPRASGVLAWTGRSLLVATADQVLERREGDLVPVATVPDGLVVGDTSGAWTGTELVLWRGDEASVVDPEAGTWERISAGGGPNRIQPAFAWADGVLVGWGGFPQQATGVVFRTPG